MSRARRRVIPTLLIAVLLTGSAAGRTSRDELELNFRSPPDSAKPRVWWHWMNGNVTKEGITADLEWMKRVGIAGFQMFDGNLGTPQFVDRRLVWMTPEWKDAFRHAAAEADRLGLEMAMAASGGWSETGGPWVKPEEAMKKVVWSETRVEGPRRFADVLPTPPSINGPFPGVARPREFDFPVANDLPGAKSQPEPPPAPPDPTYYADTKVVAYRVPDAEARMADLHPRVTSSAGDFDAAALTDGDLSRSVPLPFGEGAPPAWIRVDFERPFRAQAFSIAVEFGAPFGGGLPHGEVQVSRDGSTFETVASLPGPAHVFGAGLPVRTYAFPARTAKAYRVVFEPAPPNPQMAAFGFPQARKVDIAEVELHSGPRVNFWEDKAAFGNIPDYRGLATPAVAAREAVARANVIDLTSKMRENGTLDWDVPAGTWVILRMGCSLTGKKNSPATREATGYEVDKLSRKHVESYLHSYVGQVSEALGPHFGKSFRYFLMDSWEAGMENWTDAMEGEFRKRRGYDLTPYLPVLTGRVVESADASERFLWDFRRTLADLLADNHYGAATEYLEKRGVGLYAEAMGAQVPTAGDGLQNKGRVSVPMGEFWVYQRGQPPVADRSSDILEAASSAHVYGKTLVAAEAFTTFPPIPAWAQSPFFLKPIADKYLAMGVNRIVFHASVHQPFVDERHKPGLTLGPFGQHYTRNITWAEQAAAWNTYLARSSYLLQQGLFVGDLAYYYGEGAPVAVPYWKEIRPAPPVGFKFDYVNTEALLTRMSVKDGRLVLPDGMSYRVLVLPEDVDELTVPVVRKIRDLVAAGATVVAPKPAKSPSLADAASSDAELRKIADEVWGAIDGKSVTEHAYGKGRVYWGTAVRDVLEARQLAPDFEYKSPEEDAELDWTHRRLGDTDIYFVANQKERTEDVEARFRVEGKDAELWHPDTGEIEPAEYRIENGRTTVPLRLDPGGSVFVVFRGRAPAPSRTLSRPASSELATIQGPWQVSFPAGWGAPPQITLESLVSWTAHPGDGVKYFSGTATYAKQIEAPREWFRPGAKLVLDLGQVKEIAEVSVNGKPLGILWKPPFRADVTAALRPGTNRVEVKVTNLWTNRMIGDEQPSIEKRHTFAGFRFFTKDSPLLDSGLLGPVRVVSVAPK